MVFEVGSRLAAEYQRRVTGARWVTAIASTVALREPWNAMNTSTSVAHCCLMSSNLMVHRET